MTWTAAGKKSYCASGAKLKVRNHHEIEGVLKVQEEEDILRYKDWEYWGWRKKGRKKKGTQDD